MTSLRNLSDYLRSNGYDIADPDHTAAGDVRTLIDCYQAIRELQAKRDAQV